VNAFQAGDSRGYLNLKFYPNAHVVRENEVRILA
jgi:hypothetical protein